MAMIQKVTPPIARILPEIRVKENGGEYKIAICEPTMTKKSIHEGIAISLDMILIDKFGEANIIGKTYTYLVNDQK